MAKKYNEEEIKAVVQEETDMIDLVGVIKSEMDDAKDFIHQKIFIRPLLLFV